MTDLLASCNSTVTPAKLAVQHDQEQARWCTGEEGNAQSEAAHSMKGTHMQHVGQQLRL